MTLSKYFPTGRNSIINRLINISNTVRYKVKDTNTSATSRYPFSNQQGQTHATNPL